MVLPHLQDAADLHAERIDRILEQPNCLFDSFRSVPAQEFRGLDQFRSHRIESPRATPVYSAACTTDSRFSRNSACVARAHSERNSLHTTRQSAARLQCSLDHLKTYLGNLFQPFSLLAVIRFGVSRQPCAHQSQREPHLGAWMAFLQPEHLAVDLIFDSLTANMRGCPVWQYPFASSWQSLP